MPATITSFYNFRANQRPTYSQMNQNFDNLRGHRIPIHPNTAAAVHNTYNAGSSDYYWRSGYFSNINLLSSTTTAGLVLSGDTSNTTGAKQFKIAGTVEAEINSLGVNGNYLKSESVTIGSFHPRGTDFTTSAINGQIARSPLLNVPATNITGASTNGYVISGSTITLTSIGRPVFVGISGLCIEIFAALIVSQEPNSARMFIRKGIDNIAELLFSFDVLDLNGTVTAVTGPNRPFNSPISFFTIINPTAGAHQYSLVFQFNDTSTTIGIQNTYLYAYEL